MAWSNLVDLELDDEDKIDTMCPTAIMDVPDYPWGTKIILTHRELEKLGLDIGDCSIGDLIDMRCFGVVTCISSNRGPMGPEDRVEIQIQKMAIENEADEEDMPG
jgi:hypothetical protein